MAEHVLILGGGFGGLTAGVELKNACGEDVRVTIVDREPDYHMGLTKLWVATGSRSAASCLHPRSGVERHGIDFVQASVRKIDIANRSVQTDDASLEYDRLVVALGLDVDASAVPGIAEHGLNLYSLQGAEQIAPALRESPRRILVTICSTPFKCPPAPYEASMMIRDVVGASAAIEVTSPEPRPFPILPPEAGERVVAMLAERDITYAPGAKIVEAEAGTARYEDGSERNFDVLIVVPPHRPAALLADTGLTDGSGLVVVDRETLRTQAPNVYALGDCAKVLSYTEMPIPRTGNLAERQASVVAKNIASEIRGDEPAARFDGRGYCWVETGGQKAMRAEGEFFGRPHPIGHFAVAPDEAGYRDKVAFEKERLAAWFGR
ncbi:MAG TPA: FAD-dependent oxidoreductase [Actinomycetota bacterium]|jgi:sulfide:quinone oxidoreductase|nr:FAD-dependent oxidoreductase [Actinomycetota bacterium]